MFMPSYVLEYYYSLNQKSIHRIKSNLSSLSIILHIPSSLQNNAILYVKYLTEVEKRLRI